MYWEKKDKEGSEQDTERRRIEEGSEQDMYWEKKDKEGSEQDMYWEKKDK